jgi:hypothetical protein
MITIAELRARQDFSRSAARAKLRPKVSAELEARLLYFAGDVEELSTRAAEQSPAASQLMRTAANLLVTARAQIVEEQTESVPGQA